MGYVIGFLCTLGVIFLWVLYDLFRAGPGQDVTARGINGIQLLWIVMRQRRRLHLQIRLEDANGTELTVPHMSVLVDQHGNEYLARRPFKFLSQDLNETNGFRRNDRKVT